MRGEPGLFDVDDRLKRLSDLGDHLEAFGKAVDFEIFRCDLETSRNRDFAFDTDRSNRSM